MSQRRVDGKFGNIVVLAEVYNPAMAQMLGISVAQVPRIPVAYTAKPQAQVSQAEPSIRGSSESSA